MSNDYTPWHRSIAKLLGEAVFNSAMPAADDKRRLAEALNRIHGRLPAMAPYTPVCLLGDLRMDPYRFRMMAQALVLRGWDRHVACMVVKNFRLAYPAPRFDFDVHRVMPYEALVAEYGAFFGNAIAELFTDPGCNPLFEFLLRGDLRNGGSIRRPLGKLTLELDDRAFAAVIVEGSFTPLPLQEAGQIYYAMTGVHMPESLYTEDLSPTGLDYEEAAEIGKALWPADRAG